MLCFRCSNIQVIFTVRLDTGKQAAAHLRSSTPFSSAPASKPGEKWPSLTQAQLPRFTLAALPQGWAKFAHRDGEGTLRQLLPPAPRLLGISQATAGGLEAVRLLNTAISTSELRHTKSVLRGELFFFFSVFLPSGKASKEHSEEAASKLATLQAKQPSLRAHCSLPATSRYWLQSKKLFSP